MSLVLLQKVVTSGQFLISSGNKLKHAKLDLVVWMLLVNGISNCKPLLDLKHLSC